MRAVFILTHKRNTYSGGPTFAEYWYTMRRSVLRGYSVSSGQVPINAVLVDVVFID